MARVFIGIGSNIERESSIRAAVQALRARFGLLMLSNVYESRPIGFEGGNFYNLVAAFDADEPPEAVIATLHDIEQRLGRERETSRYTSRTIDLDLLLYGDLVRHDAELRIPRPEISEYACVLRPLAELAPGSTHPQTGLSYAQMWKRFDNRTQPLTRVNLPLPD